MRNFFTLFTLLTIALGSHSCNAQSTYEKTLIGKWILTAQSNSVGNDFEKHPNGKSTSESEIEAKTTLNFNQDRTLFINQMGNEYTSTYKLIGSTLTLGNRNYKVLHLGKKKLIFKDENGLFDNHYEYKKME